MKWVGKALFRKHLNSFNWFKFWMILKDVCCCRCYFLTSYASSLSVTFTPFVVRSNFSILSTLFHPSHFLSCFSPNIPSAPTVAIYLLNYEIKIQNEFSSVMNTSCCFHFWVELKYSYASEKYHPCPPKQNLRKYRMPVNKFLNEGEQWNNLPLRWTITGFQLFESKCHTAWLWAEV